MMSNIFIDRLNELFKAWLDAREALKDAKRAVSTAEINLTNHTNELGKYFTTGVELIQQSPQVFHNKHEAPGATRRRFTHWFDTPKEKERLLVIETYAPQNLPGADYAISFYDEAAPTERRDLPTKV